MALLAIVAFGLAMTTADREPIPYTVPAKMVDLVTLANPADVEVGGYIGARIKANEANRLRNVDLEPLLAGFRKKPGSHPWIGEHIGKWMHAATLAWANTGDAKLKEKLDYAARELIKAQEPDGYLGTYVKEKRFGLFPEADWDVWSHKYCLIGLLTYHRFTGSKEALDACRKIGDLLIATFGPGKKSILSAGTHVGMAATSVLEPVVLLYRSTGDDKYLAFANYIVDSWSTPGGPNILGSLESGAGVGKTANGKAYEMLSNIVGLCELARATGNERYRKAAEIAWDDVVENQLYLTGSASYYEHFHAGRDLPPGMPFNVGETCVTVTWMQLCQQLFRLTGEAKYADEFERSLYNHLAAAQRPDGEEWCYYTSLDGIKPYTGDTCCCLSSGPRGLAITPEESYGVVSRGGHTYLLVNTLESSSATVRIGGDTARITQTSDFPRRGHMTLKLDLPKANRFGILVRCPDWAAPMVFEGQEYAAGWVEIGPKTWRRDASFELSFAMRSKVVREGDKAAVEYGPFVMALDGGKNAALGSPLKFSLTDSPASVRDLELRIPLSDGSHDREAVFVPFAEAGSTGARYRIWLNAPGVRSPFASALFLDACERRSEEGNVQGSIADGDAGTFVVTFNGTPQKEAWFEVSVDKPVQIRRIVFAHGRTFHDGGWFDASRGKPVLEVQEKVGGAWIKAGELASYPETTATDAKGLRGGEQFTLVLPDAVPAVALRVRGVPAHGDSPKQSFASCAELQAYP